jgi:pimeloyl-ACP methyl ester carboxylesterase
MKSSTTIQINHHTIEYAEYGDLQGYPVFVFHGTPGSYKVGALFDREAQATGLRFVTLERAGYGKSPARSFTLKDYAQEIEMLATALDIDRFVTAGLSGGGPYALACAAYLPSERLIATTLISAITPLYLKGSMKGMMAGTRIIWSLGRFFPGAAGWLLGTMLRALMSGSQNKLNESGSTIPGMTVEKNRLMIDDILEGVAPGGRGIAGDIRRLWSPWEFDLEEIVGPVYLWHGEKDINVPVHQAQYIASVLPNCQAVFYAEDDHLSTGFSHVDEILHTLRAPFD